MDPVGPVFLFDERGSMDIVYDPALVDEVLDTCDEFHKGFDARARPVDVRGEPGGVHFILASEKPQESEFRQLVTRYYMKFVTRSPGPPRAESLRVFVEALAADEINE